MNKIGGSSRVRNELSAALAEGRGVTAKVRWLSRADEEGRSRWIHCTPLLGSDGRIGVWMIVVVDGDQVLGRRWRQAPPVAPHRGRVYDSSREGSDPVPNSADSSIMGATHNGASPNDKYSKTRYEARPVDKSSLRSTSPYSVAI